MVREVLQCLEPSCRHEFVLPSAYDKHIEKHINNGLYLTDVTAAGLRRAQDASHPFAYRGTNTISKRQVIRAARSPSHISLTDKNRARQALKVVKKLDQIRNQETRNAPRQSRVRFKSQAHTIRRINSERHARHHGKKDHAPKEAEHVEKRRKRWFKRIASGSIGIPSSSKGKTAIVDLRSPSRSRSPSAAMDLPGEHHDAQKGVGSSTGVLDSTLGRSSNLFTPEATPDPSARHNIAEMMTTAIEPELPCTPLSKRSINPPGPITPDSNHAKVRPTWTVSPDDSPTSHPIDMTDDKEDEEPIGELFARMMTERDELEDGDGNEADDEEMDIDIDAESSILSSDSGIEDIDPPTNDFQADPSSHHADRSRTPSGHDEPARAPLPETIEILSDTESESEKQSESEEDDWDLFDVENQIFGYRVLAGSPRPSTSTHATGGGQQNDVPKSPFKGLSPRRPRPEEFLWSRGLVVRERDRELGAWSPSQSEERCPLKARR